MLVIYYIQDNVVAERGLLLISVAFIKSADASRGLEANPREQE